MTEINDTKPSPQPSADQPSTGQHVTSSRQHELSILRAILLVLAGIVAALAIQQIYPTFFMPAELGDYPFEPSPEYVAKYNAALRGMYIKNYVLVFTVIGILFSIAIGMSAKSRIVQTTLLTAISAVVGGVIGGVLCGLFVANALIVSGRSIDLGFLSVDPLVQSILIHFVAFFCLLAGLITGAALMQPRPIQRTLTGAAMWGGVATLLQVVVGSIAFPNASVFAVIPATLVETTVWMATFSVVLFSKSRWNFIDKRPPIPNN